MEKVECKKRLLEILEYFSITKAEFCRRTGIGNSAMSRYINGDRLPRQDKVAVIAETFNLDPAWIMGFDVPMFNTHTIEYENQKNDFNRRMGFFIRGLSNAGKKELINYAEYLYKSETERKGDGDNVE